MKKMVMMTATGLMLGSAGLAQTMTERVSPTWDGYPPCSATMKDSCIQLYERGVATQANLALNENMEGSTMAVGGPYEPLASTANTTAMGHEEAVMDHGSMSATHSGAMGGPIEERTGYPPCDPGPGDDRCIQLYEPGVTGAGN